MTSGSEIAEFSHTADFRRRRFLNWFPMGLTYAFLYMGRYNLTVAKGALGDLMTKEDFGIIFAAGTITYAIAFLVNGPLVDRLGGRKGILAAALGASLANFAMGGYLHYVTSAGRPEEAPLLLVFSLLYAVNMYFQSFGAVSIVKVNAHWFHVRERGGFSGIFGTMISSGIFLAFTANQWFLDLAKVVFPGRPAQWVVFAVPGILLGLMFFIEFGLLRDRPGQAGHEDFDTGDASSGDDDSAPEPALKLIGRIITNPIILTVACIEFCTGVLRNGVMHWFPIYTQEVWALPDHHMLRYGSWEALWIIGLCFVVAAISGFIASRSKGPRRGYLVIFGGLAFLAPFVQGGWGGLLFIAGVVGGNVAGWVSDLFFQSRRAPATRAIDEREPSPAPDQVRADRGREPVPNLGAPDRPVGPVVDLHVEVPPAAGRPGDQVQGALRRLRDGRVLHLQGPALALHLRRSHQARLRLPADVAAAAAAARSRGLPR